MDVGSIVGVELHIPTWLLIILGLLLAWYINKTWKYDTFDKMGFPSIKYYAPFGHFKPIMNDGMHATTRRVYEQGKKAGAKCIGSFEPDPILYILDLDMMNEIAVKQFNCFYNRVYMYTGYPADRIPAFMMDEHWKHIRALQSPAFSTKKLKDMILHMNECSDELVEKLTEINQSGEQTNIEETISMFTFDVIARTSYGLNVGAMKNPKSEFVIQARKFLDSFTKNPKFLMSIFFPIFGTILKYLNIPVIDKSITDFFKKLFAEIEQQRKVQNVEQADLLQQLISLRVDPGAEKRAREGDLQNGDFEIGPAGLWSTKGMTSDDVLASALAFILGGYGTMSHTLATVLYCLATNPESQKRLTEEVETAIGDKEVIEYDVVVSNMPYLEGCVHESLRLYPSSPRLDRVCTQECVVGGIPIPKGMIVSMSTMGVHHDEDIWPNPEVFDPERFSRDSTSTRHSYAYQGFGHGPRNCIATRLALIEIKIVVAKILQKFEIIPTSKTKVPLTLQKFVALEDPGMDFDFVKRS